MAVWALRVGYVALIVIVVGLIAILSGSTPWVLAAGVIFWLAAAAVMVHRVLAGSAGATRAATRFWSIRWMLIHDTVHARSSAEQL